MKRFTAILLVLLMVLTAAAGAMGEENKIWMKGDRSEKVSWIQMRLKELEYLEKEPDGIFDEETEKALLEFQQDQGLLRSGMADQTTMQALEKATQKKTEKRTWTYDDAEYEATEAMSGSSYFMTAATGMPAPMANAGKAWSAETVWNTEEYTFQEQHVPEYTDITAVHFCGGC